MRMPSEENVARLIKLLRQHPMGLSGKQIAEQLAVCESWFNAMARQAKKRRAIVRMGASRWSIWFAIEHAGNYVPRERKAWETRALEKKKLIKKLLDEDYGEVPITKKVVPASEAKPLRKIGPSSVFEYASTI